MPFQIDMAPGTKFRPREISKVVRRLGAAIVALVALLFAEVSLASDVHICGMPKDEFVRVAFPDAGMTKHFGERLVKWASQPGLIVLVPEAHSELKVAFENAVAAIERDGVLKPQPNVFAAYRSIEEATLLVHSIGEGSMVIFIDSIPAEHDPAEKFASLIFSILRVPAIANSLIRNARSGGDFSVENLVEAQSGKVIATAALINPQANINKISKLIYVVYYANLSPNSRALRTAFYKEMFDLTGERTATLSDFARQFFKNFMSGEVKFGMKKSSFIECSVQ